jgi:histidine ammonia-lyase
MFMNFHYGEDNLTIGKVISLAKGLIHGLISNSQKKKIVESSEIVRNKSFGSKPIYGVNTGFGPLCTEKISTNQLIDLQRKLLLSHSMGTGNPLDHNLAKCILILKVHALAKGFSGIQVTTIQRIIWMIQNNIIPYIPEQGSVGASGDLAPLSHCFLPLMGEGKVYYNGKLEPSKKVLDQFNLKPIILGPKEGLALINGTQFIASHAVHIVQRFHNCLASADFISAMMVEALMGSSSPYHPGIHQLRNFKGNIHVAYRLNYLVDKSQINISHQDCNRVQDPYSLRCIPQVHGASRDAWLHLKERVDIEINSVTDNPIILNENEIISGGNFHGQPLAMALDYAGLAASELGSISERRIYLSLMGQTPGTPKLLMDNIGLNSGFMIMQYTAAALASENKTLCFPASADSIPTSLGQEDHVSMGSIGGRKSLQIVSNLEKILAIELIVACQAIEFRKPNKPHPILSELLENVRKLIPFATEDRLFYEDMEEAAGLIKESKLLKIVNNRIFEKYEDFRTPYEELYELF